MISDGDRILAGLSGGKDSLTLLWMLNERLSRIRVRYELFPVYIDPGFEGGFADELSSHVEKWGFNLHVEHTDDGVVAHSAENRENPCFLCARLRRKRLFELADAMNCGLIALGHNKDDIIETLFMNICYAGEISAMVPSQEFFQGKFKVIRPLAYTGEDAIRRFAGTMRFPDFDNPCPSAGTSKRKEIKDLLNRLYKSNKKIRGNIFRAMHHVNAEYLLK